MTIDPQRDLSEVVILDAQDFAGEPVATIRLPLRVPFSFHGGWAPDKITVVEWEGTAWRRHQTEWRRQTLCAPTGRALPRSPRPRSTVVRSLRNTAEMRAASAPSSKPTENLLANIIRHAKCD